MVQELREEDQPPTADGKLGSDVETTVNESVLDVDDHEDSKADESATPSSSTCSRRKKTALHERSTTCSGAEQILSQKSPSAPCHLLNTRSG